ncbi:MAG: glycosyltransferase family 4 protein [Planctomycetaceae bacterium]
MKIALVKRRYSLRHGGSERYCVNLARRLQATGHHVTVIGETIDDELKDEVEFRPVRVNRITSWTNNRSFAENCGRTARDGKFDVIYGLGRSFGLDAVRITERLQSHWVNVYYRNPVGRFFQKWNPRHRTLIDLERSIYRSNGCRRVVAQSRLDRQLVMAYYGIPEEKIRIVHNGVDISTFNPGVRSERDAVRAEFQIAADEPLLLFASMDFEGKGLRSILQAMRDSRHQDLKLLVLGHGPVRRFQRIASELGVDSRVIFAGRRNDISRFYGAADLFLLPTAYEPFPNVNLEAMACGTPALTTSTAGGADIIHHGENGYLVSSVHAVDEMTRCLNDHFSLATSSLRAMSDACWGFARTMTVEANVAKTLDVFEEVLLEKFRV